MAYNVSDRGVESSPIVRNKLFRKYLFRVKNDWKERTIIIWNMKSKANVREIRLRIGSEVMAMQWNGMRGVGGGLQSVVTHRNSIWEQTFRLRFVSTWVASQCLISNEIVYKFIFQLNSYSSEVQSTERCGSSLKYKSIHILKSVKCFLKFHF